MSKSVIINSIILAVDFRTGNFHVCCNHLGEIPTQQLGDDSDQQPDWMAKDLALELVDLPESWLATQVSDVVIKGNELHLIYVSVVPFDSKIKGSWVDANVVDDHTTNAITLARRLVN